MICLLSFFGFSFQGPHLACKVPDEAALIRLNPFRAKPGHKLIGNQGELRNRCRLNVFVLIPAIEAVSAGVGCLYSSIRFTSFYEMHRLHVDPEFFRVPDTMRDLRWKSRSFSTPSTKQRDFFRWRGSDGSVCSIRVHLVISEGPSRTKCLCVAGWGREFESERENMGDSNSGIGRNLLHGSKGLLFPTSPPKL